MSRKSMRHRRLQAWSHALTPSLTPARSLAPCRTTCSTGIAYSAPLHSCALPLTMPSPPTPALPFPCSAFIALGCTHSSFVVEAGKTYRLRLVNAGALVYMSVCFEGHSVQVVALDGIPIEPIATQCVDINSGQRWEHGRGPWCACGASGVRERVPGACRGSTGVMAVLPPCGHGSFLYELHLARRLPRPAAVPMRS